MREDEQLLRAFVATRSEDAFKRIVADHVDAVYSVATRVLNGDASMAQDIAQTVFTDLVAKAGSIRNGAMLGAWLCRRAFFVASAKVREETRRRLRERESAHMNEPTEVNEARWEEISGVLDESVQALGAADRDAIAFRFFHGWDLKKVGTALGVGEDAAQKRVARALDKLRRRLGKRGFTMSAAGLLTAMSGQSLCAAPAGLTAQVSAAVLSGASAGSGWLVQWLTTMAYLKSNAAVCGLASLVIFLALFAFTHSQPGRSSKQPPSNEAKVAAYQEGTTTNERQGPGSVSFRWSEVEASDYAQFAANLRAIGCPEQTIRDILIGRLHRDYAPRMQAIWKPEPVAYWKPGKQQSPSQAQIAAMKKLDAEKWELLKGATGRTADAQEIVDTVYLQVNELDNELAFLPEERREPARRALQESGVAARVASARPTSDAREVFPDKLKALESVLTPEELAQYRLRNSPRAQWLRNDIAYFDCTVDEFRALLDLIDQALVGKPDHLAADRETALAHARSLFGELRTREYERVTDYGYLNTRRQADRAGLPPELADQAGQIAYEVRVAVERTATDSALTPEQKRTQIEYLQTQAEQRMRVVLGPSAKPAVITSMKNTLGNTASIGLR